MPEIYTCWQMDIYEKFFVATAAKNLKRYHQKPATSYKEKPKAFSPSPP